MALPESIFRPIVMIFEILKVVKQSDQMLHLVTDGFFDTVNLGLDIQPYICTLFHLSQPYF